MVYGYLVCIPVHLQLMFRYPFYRRKNHPHVITHRYYLTHAIFPVDCLLTPCATCVDFVPPRCDTVAVACYVAGGAVMGTATAGSGVPAAIIGCNAALGTCMGTCWSVTAAAAAAPFV